ncbi:unnamed protein product [Bursaphelenchus okinawaensis]|uniref:Uncharacterized protein n=1 Tax=Bursaphelenchus okinawaensis TaxID=465554 RepID=A0A811KBP7_9BILA|nr:unnamed protein product [Bursaphelenchus okinawaensis]CAG9097470.1 unnamed protein product [Bursaphelenchus okinawaensis]
MSAHTEYPVRVVPARNKKMFLKLPFNDNTVAQAVKEAKADTKALKKVRKILKAANTKKVDVTNLQPLFVVEDKKRPEKRKAETCDQKASTMPFDRTVPSAEINFDEIDLDDLNVPYTTFTAPKQVEECQKNDEVGGITLDEDGYIIEEEDDWSEMDAITKAMIQEDNNCMMMPPPTKRPKRYFVNAVNNMFDAYDLTYELEDVVSELTEAHEDFEMKNALDKYSMLKQRKEALFLKWQLPKGFGLKKKRR